jgi:hypothetical protein
MAKAPTSIPELFGQRLDVHLPTLGSDRARFAFLNAQFSKWNYRYSAWQVDGDSELPDREFGPITATDFVLLLGEISKRRDAFEAVLKATQEARAAA